MCGQHGFTINAQSEISDQKLSIVLIRHSRVMMAHMCILHVLYKK